MPVCGLNDVCLLCVCVCVCVCMCVYMCVTQGFWRKLKQDFFDAKKKKDNERQANSKWRKLKQLVRQGKVKPLVRQGRAFAELLLSTLLYLIYHQFNTYFAPQIQGRAFSEQLLSTLFGIQASMNRMPRWLQVSRPLVLCIAAVTLIV